MTRSTDLIFSIPHDWATKEEVSVALVGSGGTGSAMLTELFQVGVLMHYLGLPRLTISVFDPDTVSLANIGRQSFWECDINHPKSSVLVNRFNHFGNTYMTAYDRAFDEEDIGSGYDMIVTCVDSAQVRRDIYAVQQEYRDHHDVEDTCLWLDTGNDKNSGQVVLGHLFKPLDDKGIRLPTVGDLYPSLMTAKDDKTQSCSHVQALQKQSYGINKAIALQASMLISKLFKDGSIKRHGSIVDIDEGYTTPININEQTWAMLGYLAPTKVQS